MLFKFLRRPDSIQLSSQFVSGQPSYLANDASDSQAPARPTWIKRKLGGRRQRKRPIDANAPWEQLEFVRIGNSASRHAPGHETSRHTMFNPTHSTQTYRTREEDIPPSRRMSQINLSSTLEMPATPASLSHSPGSSTKTGTTDALATPMYDINPLHTSEMGSSHRPSDSNTLVVSSESRNPYSLGSKGQLDNGLSPVLSQDGKFESNQDLRLSLDLGDMTGVVDMDMVNRLRWEASVAEVEEPQGQTMAEYLQETAFDNGDQHVTTQGGGDKTANGLERGMGSDGSQVMSATTYFNRQASLLMLYFPIAVSPADGRAGQC